MRVEHVWNVCEKKKSSREGPFTRSTLGPDAEKLKQACAPPWGRGCAVEELLWGVKTKKPLRTRAREGAERPSTTPGAILWARSTVNGRCPLSDSTALIYPFPRRTNAPMAVNNHVLLYGRYSSRVAQMEWPSILRIDMLRRTSTQWKPTPACHLRTRQGEPVLALIK